MANATYRSLLSRREYKPDAVRGARMRSQEGSHAYVDGNLGSLSSTEAETSRSSRLAAFSFSEKRYDKVPSAGRRLGKGLRNETWRTTDLWILRSFPVFSAGQ